MIIEQGDAQQLGDGSGHSVLQIIEAEKSPGSWAGTRQLRISGTPQFELSYWCGTCRFLFERQESTAQPIADNSFDQRLADGLGSIDADIVRTFAELLPLSEYQPLLLETTPGLTQPADEHDYFAHEQLQTYWDPAHDPKTSYYRTFQAPVSTEAHLYEFAVPMVPPAWNDEHRVQSYMAAISAGARPTAVAVSIVDISAPAVTEAADYYEHWALTHYLLDGHHKFAAAARLGLPITLLTLVAIKDGLASPEQVQEAIRVRATSADRAR